MSFMALPDSWVLIKPALYGIEGWYGNWQYVQLDILHIWIAKFSKIYANNEVSQV